LKKETLQSALSGSRRRRFLRDESKILPAGASRHDLIYGGVAVGLLAGAAISPTFGENASKPHSMPRRFNAPTK
jgi:hypothetical protein